MKKILALAALATFIAGSAHASTLAINLGNTSTDITYGAAGVLNPNIDLSTYGGLTLNTNSVVVNPAATLTNFYEQPTGTIYANNYLAVMQNPVVGSPANGLATFTLVPGQHSFAFTWGTIDDYNTLTLTDSRNVTYTITGTDILNQIAGSVVHQTQSDVNFIDTFGTIISAQLSTTQNSFEAANFGQSNVPLPTSVVLFGTALLGLALFGRRRAAA